MNNTPVPGYGQCPMCGQWTPGTETTGGVVAADHQCPPRQYPTTEVKGGRMKRPRVFYDGEGSPVPIGQGYIVLAEDYMDYLEAEVEQLRGSYKCAPEEDRYTIVETILRAREEACSAQCVWQCDNAKQSSWSTGCGHTHRFPGGDGPMENMFGWCPYCGWRIRE